MISSISTVSPMQPMIASAVMGGAAYGAYALLSRLFRFSHGDSLATVFSIGAAAVLYVAMLLVLRVFSPEEWKLIPGGNRLARLFGGKR